MLIHISGSTTSGKTTIGNKLRTILGEHADEFITEGSESWVELMNHKSNSCVYDVHGVILYIVAWKTT
jgi:uridine kinase